jgi:elongation factor P
MISTSDFKKGARFLLEGTPYTVEESQSQSPSARGTATLVKVKARNVLTGQLVQKTFKAGERFEEPDLETRPVQYLYREGELFYFLDQSSYDQHELREEEVGDNAGYLMENMECRVILFEGRPVSVEVPNVVEMLIVDCEPAVRGDTVNAVTKAATLETGLVVQVPMFVEQGTRIRVDTRDARYIERVRD